MISTPWNIISLEIRVAPTLLTFCKGLKTWFYHPTMGQFHECHVMSLLQELHWLLFKVQFKDLAITYKTLYGFNLLDFFSTRFGPSNLKAHRLLKVSTYHGGPFLWDNFFPWSKVVWYSHDFPKASRDLAAMGAELWWWLFGLHL